ncbi:MAG: glutamate--tRNA ligase [Candidatus Babeliales bacterium]
MNNVRVRFAPSPTGHLHIGSLRTALFNWLFARHNKGAFLLRIEDTDRERSYEKYVDSILNSLQWSDLVADEEIVFQSKRLDIYKKAIEQLLQEDKAYCCFCPPKPEKFGDDTVLIGEGYLKYDGRCRALRPQSEDLEKPHVIRFKFPLERETLFFTDLIRGEISFPADQFDDFILIRTDGTPVYNFVVVIDDALMQISHVIRGEDHIPNTPKQILLYEALGYSIPVFAHLPLILGPSGQRLSKREAATSVLDYRQNGYLPDALCNYLVKLGWAHGDQEIFSRSELITLFSLQEVGKSGAIFDQDKLDWLNGIYIRQMSASALLEYILKEVKPDFLKDISGWSQDTLMNFIELYKDRVKTLRAMTDEFKVMHDGSFAYDWEDCKEYIEPNIVLYLQNIVERCESLKDFSNEQVKNALKKLCKESDIKLIQIAQPLRIALTGFSNGPGVFELMALLGKKESIRRITQFIKYLQHSFNS